jgi:hypothetical protein
VPSAKLPSTPAGWLVATAAALAGLLAGFVVINTLGRIV